MGFEGEELYFQMPKRVLREKNQFEKLYNFEYGKKTFFLLLG